MHGGDELAGDGQLARAESAMGHRTQQPPATAATETTPIIEAAPAAFSGSRAQVSSARVGDAVRWATRASQTVPVGCVTSIGISLRCNADYQHDKPGRYGPKSRAARKHRRDRAQEQCDPATYPTTGWCAPAASVREAGNI